MPERPPNSNGMEFIRSICLISGIVDVMVAVHDFYLGNLTKAVVTAALSLLCLYYYFKTARQ